MKFDEKDMDFKTIGNEYLKGVRLSFEEMQTRFT
jgi:hypothetical protein